MIHTLLVDSLAKLCVALFYHIEGITNQKIMFMVYDGLLNIY